MRIGQTADRAANYLQLEALDPLPCGCVAAIFRVGRQGVRLMSVEAKGPYCLTLQHAAGRFVEPADEEMASVDP
jgi:hypothetical protein